MNSLNNAKSITFDAESRLYETYQIQAQIQAQMQGLTTSELIFKAMQDYADKYFKTKKNMKLINFSRGVTLRPGAKDFLYDELRKDVLI